MKKKFAEYARLYVEMFFIDFTQIPRWRQLMRPAGTKVCLCMRSKVCERSREYLTSVSQMSAKFNKIMSCELITDSTGISV